MSSSESDPFPSTALSNTAVTKSSSSEDTVLSSIEAMAATGFDFLEEEELFAEVEMIILGGLPAASWEAVIFLYPVPSGNPLGQSWLP